MNWTKLTDQLSVPLVALQSVTLSAWLAVLCLNGAFLVYLLRTRPALR